MIIKRMKPVIKGLAKNATQSIDYKKKVSELEIDIKCKDDVIAYLEKQIKTLKQIIAIVVLLNGVAYAIMGYILFS